MLKTEVGQRDGRRGKIYYIIISTCGVWSAGFKFDLKEKTIKDLQLLKKFIHNIYSNKYL